MIPLTSRETSMSNISSLSEEDRLSTTPAEEGTSGLNTTPRGRSSESIGPDPDGDQDLMISHDKTLDALTVSDEDDTDTSSISQVDLDHNYASASIKDKLTAVIDAQSVPETVVRADGGLQSKNQKETDISSQTHKAGGMTKVVATDSTNIMDQNDHSTSQPSCQSRKPSDSESGPTAGYSTATDMEIISELDTGKTSQKARKKQSKTKQDKKQKGKKKKTTKKGKDKTDDLDIHENVEEAVEIKSESAVAGLSPDENNSQLPIEKPKAIYKKSRGRVEIVDLDETPQPKDIKGKYDGLLNI